MGEKDRFVAHLFFALLILSNSIETAVVLDIDLRSNCGAMQIVG